MENNVIRTANDCVADSAKQVKGYKEDGVDSLPFEILTISRLKRAFTSP